MPNIRRYCRDWKPICNFYLTSEDNLKYDTQSNESIKYNSVYLTYNYI